MNNIIRIGATGRLSQSVTYQGTVYLTGQTAADRTQDVQGQTREILQKIDTLLDQAGTDKTRILFAQIWLKHVVADFGAMNAVWEAWTDRDFAPTRATVQADMAAEDILVEIAVTAAVAS